MKIIFLSLLSFIIFKAYAGISPGDIKWAKESNVLFILQNREVSKIGKSHLALGSGINYADPYYNSINFQGRYGHFFNEHWGFEGVGSYNRSEENSALKSLNDSGALGLRRNLKYYFGLLLLLSPVYGKMTLLDYMFHFDLVFGAGASYVREENNLQGVIQNTNDSSLAQEEGHLAFIPQFTLKMYFWEKYNIRMDLLANMYQDVGGSQRSNLKNNQLFIHYDFNISLEYMY